MPKSHLIRFRALYGNHFKQEKQLINSSRIRTFYSGTEYTLYTAFLLWVYSGIQFVSDYLGKYYYEIYSGNMLCIYSGIYSGNVILFGKCHNDNGPLAYSGEISYSGNQSRKSLYDWRKAINIQRASFSEVYAPCICQIFTLKLLPVPFSPLTLFLHFPLLPFHFPLLHAPFYVKSKESGTVVNKIGLW